MADTGQVVHYKDGFKIDADTIAVENTLEGTMFAAGNWTPTVAGGPNVAALAPTAARYQRVGNNIFFTAAFDITTTAAASTSFTFTLPIPQVDFDIFEIKTGIVTISKFIAGTFVSGDVNITNATTGQVRFISPTTSSQVVTAMMMYEAVQT